MSIKQYAFLTFFSNRFMGLCAKISTWLEDQKKSLLLYAALSTGQVVLITVILHAVAPLSYDINGSDDRKMNEALAGTMGDAYPGYAVYINIILGKFISWLYSINHYINWYGWILLLAVLSAFCMFGFFSFQKFGLIKGFIISSLCNYFYLLTILTQIQWTLSAYCALMSSLFLFAYAGTQHKTITRALLYFLSLCFFTFMAWIRGAVAEPAIVFFLVLLFCEALAKGKKVIVSFCVFLVFLCVWQAGVQINTYFYELKHENWREYKEFNRVRSEMRDYGRRDYEENRAAYEAVGWTELDVSLIESYILPEDEKFSKMNLAFLAENTNGQKRNPWIWVSEYLKILKNYEVKFSILMLGGGSIILFLSKRKRDAFICFAFMGIAMGLSLYLVIRGRSIFRAYFPLFMISTMFAFFLYGLPNIRLQAKLSLPKKLSLLSETRLPRKIGTVIFLAFMLFMALRYGVKLESAHTVYEKNAAKRMNTSEISSYFAAHPENVYLYQPISIALDRSLTIFDSPPYREKPNSISTYGWANNRSPYTDYFKEINQINHILGDLLTKENYYCLLNMDSLKLLTKYFINEFYIYPIFEKVDTVAYTDIYSVKPMDNLYVIWPIVDDSRGESYVTGQALVTAKDGAWTFAGWEPSDLPGIIDDGYMQYSTGVEVGSVDVWNENGFPHIYINDVRKHGDTISLVTFAIFNVKDGSEKMTHWYGAERREGTNDWEVTLPADEFTWELGDE